MLDETTIAQIAAGEVVERPVSVVKELVENSLDAGATHVSVELSEGGLAAIAVVDDGFGIARDELAIAVQRHSTSKLVRASDLFAVKTLGFRGEGLASIAAAGRLELISRPAGEEFAARIEARGTWTGEPASAAAPPGTKAVVRDLFALVPARREFLKSPRAEFARVSAYLSHLALGWPQVGFALRHDGREIWALPRVADAADRLEMVFGRNGGARLLKILEGDERGPESVSGYICPPGHDRPNREQQVFFVNGRLVSSPSLGAAWLAGYASFGMTGRYPYGVISIDVPPESVDVNVHPTKREVRFARAPVIFEIVKRAVARTLRSVQPARAMDVPLGRAEARPLHLRAEAQPLHSRAEALESGLRPEHDRYDASRAEARPLHPSMLVTGTRDVRVYGQVDQTYIVAGDALGLLIIDQHAAHERIAYEALLARAGEVETADLLFPTVVELSPAHASALGEFESELRAAGVIVEQFGDRTFRISALPAGYATRRFDLAGILDDLLAEDTEREGVAHRNRVLATIACHSVVRAHEPLSLAEQTTLYERLMACRDPQTCPHGRPTMLRLDATALAKAFRRV